MDGPTTAPTITPTPTHTTSHGSGIRSRITVVCAECKRLKLKCDRRTPCASCVKRDTISRCLYSAAAAEKVDVQSLHNRLMVLEATVLTLTSGQRKPAAPGDNERSVLARGLSGTSSIVVSLDDVASIWLDHLDVSKDIKLHVPTPDYPDQNRDLAFPDMRLFTDPDFPEDGPCVTSKLLEQLPNDSDREMLMAQLEATMTMHPCFNFLHFRTRVESMFLPPFPSTHSSPSGSSGPSSSQKRRSSRPTLAFFASVAGGLALGARVWSTLHRDSPEGTPPPASFSADTLFMLSKQALAVTEFNHNYDIDFIVATIFNGLYLLHDGKARVAHTIYPTVGKLVNIARMMGLHIDPDEHGTSSFSLFEAEARRRIWWDVYYYDVFMSDCMGHDASIDDESYSTRMPADVDESLFHPGSKTLPPPTETSNFAYFIQKCRLAKLVKTMRRKSFADQPTMEMCLESATEFENEITVWMSELPAPFRLPARPDPAASATESPFLLAQRCELAALANSLILKAYSPLLKRTPSRPTPPHQATTACSTAAHVIVTASHGLFSVFKHSRPASYMFYSFGRQIFVAAAIAASIVIQTPTALTAEPAMRDLERVLELMRDPVVATARGRGIDPSAPSEALRVVEMLHAKAEEALKQGPVAGSKRKHNDLDEVVPPGFQLPFIGSGIVTGSADPPRSASVAGPSPKTKPRSGTVNGDSRTRKGSQVGDTRDVPSTSTSRPRPSPPIAHVPSNAPSVASSRHGRDRHKSQYPSIGIRVRPRTAGSSSVSSSNHSSAHGPRGPGSASAASPPASVSHAPPSEPSFRAPMPPQPQPQPQPPPQPHRPPSSASSHTGLMAPPSPYEMSYTPAPGSSYSFGDPSSFNPDSSGPVFSAPPPLSPVSGPPSYYMPHSYDSGGGGGGGPLGSEPGGGSIYGSDHGGPSSSSHDMMGVTMSGSSRPSPDTQHMAVNPQSHGGPMGSHGHSLQHSLHRPEHDHIPPSPHYSTIQPHATLGHRPRQNSLPYTAQSPHPQMMQRPQYGDNGMKPSYDRPGGDGGGPMGSGSQPPPPVTYGNGMQPISAPTAWDDRPPPQPHSQTHPLNLAHGSPTYQQPPPTPQWSTYDY